MNEADHQAELEAERGPRVADAPSEFLLTTPSVNVGERYDGVTQLGTTSLQRLWRRVAGSSAAYMFVVLSIMFGVFSVMSPQTFPTIGNERNLIVDTSIFLVMATGMTYVMVAGGLDLSIGSVLVFSGICASKAMGWIGGDGYWTVLVGLIAALLGGAAWGFFNGFCVTKLRVPALITTLGTLGAALGIANLLTNGNDVAIGQHAMFQLQTAYILGMPWIVWISLLVLILGGSVLRFTRFGRHTYVIGSNDEAARRAGINVSRHLIKLYALSGTLAGAAGMMSLVRFSTTTIGGHSQDPLTVITGVILGGTSLYGGIGSVLGSVIGIFVPTVLQNGLVVENVQPFWQNVAVGFILIAAVYLDQLKRRSRELS